MSRSIHQGGYTLLELLAVFTLMLSVLGLCLRLFIDTTRLSEANTGALDRLNQMRELEGEFVQTARGATGAAEAAGVFRTGEDTLVLHLPSRDGGRRCAVFGAFVRKNHISRAVLHEANGTWETESLETYALPVGTLRFSWEGAAVEGARLVRMHVGAADGLRPETRVQRVLAACRGIER